MDATVIAMTIACAIACAALVIAEWRQARNLRVVAKLAASAAFVIVGLQAIGGADRAVRDASGVEYARAMLAGLVLGAIGDACLLGHTRRWFLGGLVAFLLGHLAYVGGIALIEPPDRWLGDAGWLAALPISAGLGVLVVLWPRLGSLRLPVIAYVATISVMVVAAIAAARGAPMPEPTRNRLLVGACVFFVSDLAVARDRFVGHSVANKLWGLPSYYAGQLLLAWSIAGT